MSTRRLLDVGRSLRAKLFILFSSLAPGFDFRLNERAANMAGSLEMEGLRIWINAG